MKKTILFVLMLFQALVTFADHVTTEEALSKACAFMGSRQNGRKKVMGQQRSMHLVKTASQIEQEKRGVLPAYYIFNTADSTGFVIVSAESDTREILAYSDEGIFHVEDIDKGAEVFLKQYEKDAEMVRHSSLNNEQRRYVSGKASSSNEVLLKTANLSQVSGNWEKYTPVNNAPAGCVATAETIIMLYHQYPVSGWGTLSYTKEDGTKVKWDLEEDTFNWACIPQDSPDYNNSLSEEAKDEIAKILLAVGVANGTEYIAGGSNACADWVGKNMAYRFNYSSAYEINHDDANGWERAKNSLDNNMPVLVHGDGHAYVMDGYNSQYYHYNLGWGGLNNGWYVNGSITGLNYHIESLVTHIRPPKGELIDSRTFSSGVECKFYDNATLKVSGTGTVPDNMLRPLGWRVSYIDIEEGVTAIGKEAFDQFDNFKSISIPSTVTNILESPWDHNCSQYKIKVSKDNPRYEAPDGKYLYDKQEKNLLAVVYWDSDELENFKFPEGVKRLGAYAMEGKRKQIEFPEGFESLGENALSMVDGLSEVTLPSTMKEIDLLAFQGRPITKLTCKAIVPPPAKDAFYWNSDLHDNATIFVPSVSLIRYETADGWKELHEFLPIPGTENAEDPLTVKIEVPEAGTLESIFPQDFEKSSKVQISGQLNSNDIWTIRNKAIDKAILLDLSKAHIEDNTIPCSTLRFTDIRDLQLPETLVEIDWGVIPTRITRLEIPASVKRIVSSAIERTRIKALYIPAGVEELGTNFCFDNEALSKIEVDPANKNYYSDNNMVFTADGKRLIASINQNTDNLSIPEGTEIIEQKIFSNSSIRNLELPSTLKEIASYALDINTLETVTSKAFLPPSIESNAFGDTGNQGVSMAKANAQNLQARNTALATLYVPYTAVDRYKKSEKWNIWKEILPISGSENWNDPYDGVENQININLETAGTLQAEMPDIIPLECEITLSGQINGDDIVVLRNLSMHNKSKIAKLDLSKARIVEGGSEIQTENDQIPNSMFFDCEMSELILPETITKINCCILPTYGVKRIDVPEGVKTIGKYAFGGSEVETITLPASIDNMEGCIAYNTPSLKSIVVDEANPYYKTIDNFLFSKDGKQLLSSACREGELSIPEGVETIGDYVFLFNHITRLILPSTVKELGFEAFCQDISVKEVICYAVTPPSDNDAFDFYPWINDIPLYVPAESVEAYKAVFTEKGFVVKSLEECGVHQITYSQDDDMSNSIYNLRGIRVNGLQRGLNIVRGKDGSYRKVMK